MNNCLVCLVAYEPKSIAQKYCSLRCKGISRGRKKYAKEKARRNAEPLARWTCKQCAVVFDRKYLRQVYCGIECAELYRRLRMKQRIALLEAKKQNVVKKIQFDKTCKQCELSFKTHKHRKIFCNDDCSKAYYHKTNRIRKYKKLKILEQAGACESCGFNNTHALQIHHINTTKKDNSYTNLMVLCANCHNIYHNKFGRDKRSENMSKQFVIDTILQVSD